MTPCFVRLCNGVEVILIQSRELTAGFLIVMEWQQAEGHAVLTKLGATGIHVRLLRASAVEGSFHQMASEERGWIAGIDQHPALAERLPLLLRAVWTTQRGVHWSPVLQKGALGLRRILALWLSELLTVLQMSQLLALVWLQQAASAA